MKELVRRYGVASAGLGTAITMTMFMLAPGANATTPDPDPIGKTDIDNLKDTVTTYGTAVLAVVVVGVGLLLALKYIRKAASKA